MKKLEAIFTEANRLHLYDARTKSVKKLEQTMANNGDLNVSITKKGMIWVTSHGRKNVKVSVNSVTKYFYHEIVSPATVLLSVEKTLLSISLNPNTPKG